MKTFCILAIFPLLACAELIPANRLAPSWNPGTHTGVYGGISNRTLTINAHLVFGADKTGVSNASTAINTAWEWCSTNTGGTNVVYLPAGVYNLSNAIGSYTLGGITLRGDGTNTVLLINNNNGGGNLVIGNEAHYDWTYPISTNTILGGLTKGSTNLHVVNNSFASVGNLLQIQWANDTNPVLHISGENGMRKQVALVTGKLGTTNIQIWPPILGDTSTSAVCRATTKIAGVGIEDLFIECTNSTATFTIAFGQAYNSWVKGVRIHKAYHYPVFMEGCLFMEARENYIDELQSVGSNGAGFLLGGSYNGTWSSLIEDNIIYHTFPHVEVNSGSAGNVIACNFMERNDIPGGDYVLALDINHAPHNTFNLYEGNVVANIISDGYFGGSSEDTIFRNLLHGSNAATAYSGGEGLWLKRFTRNASVVGNVISIPVVMGQPNISDASHIGTNTASSWLDWGAASNTVKRWTGTIQTRTSDSSGTALFDTSELLALTNAATRHYQPAKTFGASFAQFIDLGAVISATQIVLTNLAGTGTMPAESATFYLYPGSLGFQEIDNDTVATTTLKGNYYLDGVTPTESLGGDTMPNSLYRDSKPSFFGSLDWPAFGDDLTPKVGTIPAVQRYYGIQAETRAVVSQGIIIRGTIIR